MEDTVEKVLKPCAHCGVNVTTHMRREDWVWHVANGCRLQGSHPRQWWNTRAAINAMSDVREALTYFVSRERSIKIDIGSAHKARGAGASDFMREDDADFRRELEAAFVKARAALESLSGSGKRPCPEVDLRVVAPDEWLVPKP